MGDAEDVITCPICEEPTTIGATCERCGGRLGAELAAEILEDQLAGEAY